MTLKAVVPPSMLIPFSYARDSDAALQVAIDKCQADAVCRERAGDTRGHLAATIARLSQAPEEVRVLNREGREVTITLGPGLFADMIRNMMYASQGAIDALTRIRDARGASCGRLPKPPSASSGATPSTRASGCS